MQACPPNIKAQAHANHCGVCRTRERRPRCLPGTLDLYVSQIEAKMGWAL